MPDQFTRADSLREYLTGASSDGGTQTDPAASLGHYRSATEAASLGISLANALTGAVVHYAGGSNPLGVGTLTAVDNDTLTWKPFGASVAGAPVAFGGTGTKIVEALTFPGQFLRVEKTANFAGGPCQVTLSELVENQFGMKEVSVADAVAGVTNYWASIVKNEASGSVTNLKRWIGQIGTSQPIATSGSLGAGGAGTLTTSNTFVSWPESGWCQVRQSGGTLREVVYYTSRTTTVLNVPSAGRGLLGTSAGAGADGDILYSVPGIAIGIDDAGVQAAGSSIQTIADDTTAPTGITWSLGLDLSTGLNIGTLTAGQLVGIWIKRHVPAGAKATPLMHILMEGSFVAA